MNTALRSIFVMAGIALLSTLRLDAAEESFVYKLKSEDKGKKYAIELWNGKLFVGSNTELFLLEKSAPDKAEPQPDRIAKTNERFHFGPFSCSPDWTTIAWLQNGADGSEVHFQDFKQKRKSQHLNYSEAYFPRLISSTHGYLTFKSGLLEVLDLTANPPKVIGQENNDALFGPGSVIDHKQQYYFYTSHANRFGLYDIREPTKPRLVWKQALPNVFPAKDRALIRSCFTPDAKRILIAAADSLMLIDAADGKVLDEVDLPKMNWHNLNTCPWAEYLSCREKTVCFGGNIGGDQVELTPQQGMIAMFEIQDDKLVYLSGRVVDAVLASENRSERCYARINGDIWGIRPEDLEAVIRKQKQAQATKAP